MSCPTFTHDGNARLKGRQVVRIFQLRRVHVLKGISGGMKGGSNVGGNGKEGNNAGTGAGLVPNWMSPPPSLHRVPWHVYAFCRSSVRVRRHARYGSLSRRSMYRS